MRRKNTKTKNPALVLNEPFYDMHEEGAQWQIETGGGVVGLLGPPVTVLAAGRGGQNVQRSATGFTHDVEADQRLIDRTIRRYGGRGGQVGQYHRHPSGMVRPSAQDNRTAREWFTAFGDGRPVIVMILTEPRGSTKLQLFMYGLFHSRGRLQRMPYEVVDEGDPRVQEALRQAPVTPQVRDTAFWSEPQFVFYETRVGRTRIRAELAALREAGWTVDTVGPIRGHGLRLRAEHSGVYLEAELPPEYPLAPPRLFKHGIELVQIPELAQWNTDRGLKDVMHEALAILQCPRCTRHHLPNIIKEHQ